MRSLGFRLPTLMLAMLLLALPVMGVKAASVSAQSLGAGELLVVPDPGSETVFPFGTGQPTYQYCWKKSTQIQLICNVNHLLSQAPTIQLGGFTLGVDYNLVVLCYCLDYVDSNNVKHWAWKTLASTHFHYTQPSPSQPQLVRTDRVRIRSLQSSQCAYFDPNGWVTRHWVCYPDPNFFFYRDVYSDGFSTFRENRSGRCLWGGQRNVPPTGSAVCGALGTRFQVQDAGSGQVRLNVPVTGTPLQLGAGGCFFADGGNGGTMLKEPCSGNQRTLFVLDPA